MTRPLLGDVGGRKHLPESMSKGDCSSIREKRHDIHSPILIIVDDIHCVEIQNLKLPRLIQQQTRPSGTYTLCYSLSEAAQETPIEDIRSSSTRAHP